MNFTNILSTFIVICTIGCVNASNKKIVDFSFSSYDHGFMASAQYWNNKHKVTTVLANNMEEFAENVNEAFGNMISFSSADRGSFDLKEGTKYSLQKNKEGLYEYLCFNGVKCSDDLYGIRFNVTQDYQPVLRLNFDNAQDAKLPHIICNFVPIINFNVENAQHKEVIKLKSFNTNCSTGLSYNVPLYIYANDFNYNNYKKDFRELCMMAEFKK